jgi:uncharacterized protein YdhG (YjbR/CyaY superfamily)
MKLAAKPTTLEEYIHVSAENVQERLREMLACLRKAAPEAEESLKWGNPALSYDHILFIFAGFKNHVSLYPTPSVIEVFKDKLTQYKTTGSTIQFPLDKPLPTDLIYEIAGYRVRDCVENDAKWM